MKVVFVTTDINYGGGGERVLITLSNFFQKFYKWDISIISLLKTETKNPYEINDNIKIYYLNNTKEEIDKKNKILRGIKKLLNIKKINQKLSYIEKDQKIDAIIGIGFENSWYLPLINKKQKTKKIGTQHTSYYEFDRKNIMEKNIWKYLLKKLDDFVVLTPDAKDYFKLKLKLKNVEIIANPNPYEIKDIDYKKDKIVLCVGRLNDEKQVNKLVEIWSKVSLNKKNEWKLLIIGDGPDKEKINQQIINLKLEDQIKLIGKISNLEEYYKRASILVSVSKTESFSMVLIEALTFKICPIFYDCPTGPRNIIKNEINGFLIELDNKIEMIKKIETLLINDELRNKISRNTFNNLEIYKIERICEKWKEILID